MKKIFSILAVALFACSHRADQISIEEGVVVEKSFSPPKNLSGYGINTNGDLHYQELNEDAKFFLVFHCFGHNSTFMVNDQRVYGLVDKGDTVQIQYYEIVSGDKVVDYEFHGASKISKW